MTTLLLVWACGIAIHLAFFTFHFTAQSARGEHDHLDARGLFYLWSIALGISTLWPVFMAAYVPHYLRDKRR